MSHKIHSTFLHSHSQKIRYQHNFFLKEYIQNGKNKIVKNKKNSGENYSRLPAYLRTGKKIKIQDFHSSFRLCITLALNKWFNKLDCGFSVKLLRIWYVFSRSQLTCLHTHVTCCTSRPNKCKQLHYVAIGQSLAIPNSLKTTIYNTIKWCSFQLFGQQNVILFEACTFLTDYLSQSLLFSVFL